MYGSETTRRVGFEKKAEFTVQAVAEESALQESSAQDTLMEMTSEETTVSEEKTLIHFQFRANIWYTKEETRGRFFCLPNQHFFSFKRKTVFVNPF